MEVLDSEPNDDYWNEHVVKADKANSEYLEYYESLFINGLKLGFELGWCTF